MFVAKNTPSLHTSIYGEKNIPTKIYVFIEFDPANSKCHLSVPKSQFFIEFSKRSLSRLRKKEKVFHYILLKISLIYSLFLSSTPHFF